jgi:hypothetical protein
MQKSISFNFNVIIKRFLVRHARESSYVVLLVLKLKKNIVLTNLEIYFEYLIIVINLWIKSLLSFKQQMCIRLYS